MTSRQQTHISMEQVEAARAMKGDKKEVSIGRAIMASLAAYAVATSVFSLEPGSAMVAAAITGMAVKQNGMGELEKKFTATDDVDRCIYKRDRT